MAAGNTDEVPAVASSDAVNIGGAVANETETSKISGKLEKAQP